MGPPLFPGISEDRKQTQIFSRVVDSQKFHHHCSQQMYLFREWVLSKFGLHLTCNKYSPLKISNRTTQERPRGFRWKDDFKVPPSHLSLSLWSLSNMHVIPAQNSSTKAFILHRSPSIPTIILTGNKLKIILTRRNCSKTIYHTQFISNTLLSVTAEERELMASALNLLIR